MDKLTYRQAYDKIIGAYFKDQIQPYLGEFCFCGTLAGFDIAKDNTCHGWPTTNYSAEELLSMEAALLGTIKNVVGGKGHYYHPFGLGDPSDRIKVFNHPKYEDALFSGMCAALDVLKEIHRSRGENVDEDIPAFTKRELVKAI